MGISVFDKEKFRQMQEKEKKMKQHTIMIVDDEEAILISMKYLLSEDYQVITAKDGQEALDIVNKIEHKEDISLIISDQRMPKLTGIRLFEKIKDKLPNTRLMILTGYNDQDVIIDAINKVHVHQFILKPFEPDDLKLKVKRAVEEFDRKLDKEANHLELAKNYPKLKKKYQALKRENKELRHQLSKYQAIPLTIPENREKPIMKVPEKKGNWQDSMKIKPKLLVPPDEAFAPMDDILEDYI